jgi:hypothetical protein
MDNPYMSYYIEQAGSGISGYSGSRYQHGNGFLGKIFKRLKPALKYFGREGIKTASSIGRDLLNGENFIESVKANLVNTGRNIMTDAIGKAEDYVKQNGNGLKRKRVYKKPVKRRKVVKKKARKTIKRPKRTLKKKKNIDFF